jgi:hypothetical protein
MTTNAQDAAAAERAAFDAGVKAGRLAAGDPQSPYIEAAWSDYIRTLRAGGEAVANSACPLCKAPSVRTVNPRGGEWGWGTTDEERATYRYAAPPAAQPEREGKVAFLPAIPVGLVQEMRQWADRADEPDGAQTEAHAAFVVRDWADRIDALVRRVLGDCVCQKYEGVDCPKCFRAPALASAPSGGAVDARECTCHPDDNPPRPCPRKFAYNECVAAARELDRAATLDAGATDAVVWPPLARESEDHVMLDCGRECLPLSGRGEPNPISDEKGTWNRAIEECQRAVSMARGIGRERAYPLARWLTVHFRNGNVPEAREIADLLLCAAPSASPPAGDAVAGLVDAVDRIAAFLVGYGDTAEFAAKQLRDALAAFDAAALQSSGREGMVLVPREPTEAMIAAHEVAWFSADGDARKAWAMMLAAAPRQDGAEGVG